MALNTNQCSSVFSSHANFKKVLVDHFKRKNEEKEMNEEEDEERKEEEEMEE